MREKKTKFQAFQIITTLQLKEGWAPITFCKIQILLELIYVEMYICYLTTSFGCFRGKHETKLSKWLTINFTSNLFITSWCSLTNNGGFCVTRQPKNALMRLLRSSLGVVTHMIEITRKTLKWHWKIKTCQIKNR